MSEPIEVLERIARALERVADNSDRVAADVATVRQVVQSEYDRSRSRSDYIRPPEPPGETLDLTIESAIAADRTEAEARAKAQQQADADKAREQRAGEEPHA